MWVKLFSWIRLSYGYLVVRGHSHAEQQSMRTFLVKGHVIAQL